MKLSWSMTFQILAGLLHAGNLISTSVPTSWKPYVALGLGLAQVLVNWYAHNSNPDGSPASVAYLPPAK